MHDALDHLTLMNDALTACVQGRIPQSEMIALWRKGAAQLALPEKFGIVLGDLLDRLEASALFSEESCSFSQKDLLDSLQLWAEKAQARLSTS
ncbi:MAG: hypothetical protein RLZZ464_2490 [Pseudomonadota bacterium]|jgi:hypothetical protein